MEILFDKIEDYTREKLKKEKVTGIDHVLRVWRWCEILANNEDVDMEVLHAAALLHDVSCPIKGRKHHYEESAEMAEEFLTKIGYPVEKINKVFHAIRAHSRFGGPDPITREAEILYDADVLDFIGAIGLVRGVTRGFEGDFIGDVCEAPALFYNMKKKAGKTFYTAKAKEIAEGRFKIIDDFIERLKDELEFLK